MKTISIIGLGYIGLPTAITLAGAGYDVIGFDINAEVVETLQNGKIHIVEPGLQEALTKAIEKGNLRFTDELGISDVYYICVPTPFYEDELGEKHADLSYVNDAGRMVGRVMREDSLVILESTVPPRTTEYLSAIISQQSGFAIDKLNLAHCPERIIPGKMLHELKNNDRIIGARTETAAQMTKEIYENLLENGSCYVTDDITAEMCKLTENTFRDINIAYANELSVLCQRMGIDVFELIELANCHPRVNILSPGVGVGGHCIAVDPWFIYEQAPDDARLIHAARLRNDNKPFFVAEQVMQRLEGVAEPTIAVLGLSYKPGVDDLRESPSMILCNILKEKGVNVLGVEPYVALGKIDGVQNVTLETAIEQADFLIVTLAHTEFLEKKERIATKPYYDCVGLMHTSILRK